MADKLATAFIDIVADNSRLNAGLRQSKNDIDQFAEGAGVNAGIDFQVGPTIRRARAEMLKFVEEIEGILQEAVVLEIITDQGALTEALQSLDQLKEDFADGFDAAGLEFMKKLREGMKQSVVESLKVKEEAKKTTAALKVMDGALERAELVKRFKSARKEAEELREESERVAKAQEEIEAEKLIELEASEVAATKAAKDLSEELEIVKRAAQIEESFTRGNLVKRFNDAREAAKNLRKENESAADAIDPYKVNMDEINQKINSHIQGASDVIDELQEIHDAARNVSGELGRSSVNLSKIISVGKNTVAVFSALAVSIQQTNEFIKERAEKYYEIQKLKEKELDQERELAKIAEDRLKGLADKAKEESGSGKSATLDTLKEELKAAENNSNALLKIRSKLKAKFEEEQKKRKEVIEANAAPIEFGGQNLGKNFGESIEALKDATFGSDLTKAKEDFDKANASLEESNAKYKKLQEIIEEVEKAGEEKAEKEKKASNDQAAASQKRIDLLKLEAELHGKTGQAREAVQQKIDRLNASEENTPSQTNAEVEAKAAVRAAEEKRKAEEEARQETERNEQSVIDIIKANREAIATFDKTEMSVARYKAQLAGATPSQLQMIDNQEKTIQKLKDEKELRDAATETIKANRTASEKYVDALREIEKQSGVPGGLSPEQAARAAKAASDQFKSDFEAEQDLEKKVKLKPEFLGLQDFNNKIQSAIFESNDNLAKEQLAKAEQQRALAAEGNESLRTIATDIAKIGVAS